jgi:uncharacterized protein
MAITEEPVRSSRIDPYGNVTERRSTASVTENRCEANVFLQPVAPPSILGMFALAGSTFMIGAWMAGWYGSAFSPFYIAPFVGIIGGAAQLVAAVWSYRARDGMATAVHGTWGSFFLAFGLLYAMFSFQPTLVPMGPVFTELGFCFIVVAAISWCLSLAAMAQRLALAAVVMSISGGATFAAIALLTGVAWCEILSGYLFLLSALCGLYDAMAHVLKEVYGHEVLKLGYSEKVLAEPGIMSGTGEPGVIHGQR